MMSEIEQARWAQERGSILRTLKEDYVREMTSVRSLVRALDAQGISLSQDGIGFHLIYLADQGYVQIWRARDLPQFRRDRPMIFSACTVVFAKMLPKGLQLINGTIREDPGVSF
jgi:DNA-binding transcriptional ArsR family regulator